MERKYVMRRFPLLLFLLGGVFGVCFFVGSSLLREWGFREDVRARTKLRLELETEYNEAKRLVFIEKYVEAIPKLEWYIRNAEYLSSIGKGDSVGLAEVQLSSCRYFQDSRELSVESLQRIVATPGYSDRVRAAALVQLGDFLQEDFDDGLIRRVFSYSGEMRGLLIEGNPDRSAESLYHRALQLDPDTGEAYSGLAEISLRWSAFRSGRVFFDRASLEENISQVISGMNAHEDRLSAGPEKLLWNRRVALYQVLFSPVTRSAPVSGEWISDVRRNFETLIQTLDQLDKDSLRVRYEYVDWAFRFQKEDVGQDALRSLLERLPSGEEDPRRIRFLRFLGNLKGYPDHSYYQTAIHAGRLDERMGLLLLDRGWSDTVLKE